MSPRPDEVASGASVGPGAAGGVTLSEEDVAAFASDAKIALVATLDGEGLPHVSLITSLQARSRTQLMFGQFSEGLSKAQLRENPRAAFLVLTQDRSLWRGQACWTHTARHGEDYDLYNEKPMFRYNAYSGVHTVHYLDLLEFTGREKLRVAGLVGGTVGTRVSSLFVPTEDEDPALTPWAVRHIANPATLKFLGFATEDGYPWIVPTVPALSVGGRRIVFSPSIYRCELDEIEPGQPVAMYALNLHMESVLLRGRFAGYRRYGCLRAGTVDIDWVYNSMPPKHGQIYPPAPLGPVVTDGGSAPFVPSERS